MHAGIGAEQTCLPFLTRGNADTFSLWEKNIYMWIATTNESLWLSLCTKRERECVCVERRPGAEVDGKGQSRSSSIGISWSSREDRGLAAICVLHITCMHGWFGGLDLVTANLSSVSEYVHVQIKHCETEFGSEILQGT